MLRSRKFEAIKKETIRRRVMLFILIYLVFITAYLSVNTMSKYVGTTEGAGTVEVAKWEVSTGTNSTDTMNVVAGSEAKTYNIIVTSTSEVGCSYGIKVSNVPANVTVKLDGKDPDAGGTGVEGELSFSNVDHFDANASQTQHVHVLSVEAAIGASTVNEKEIGIDVVFVQDTVQ